MVNPSPTWRPQAWTGRTIAAGLLLSALVGCGAGVANPAAENPTALPARGPGSIRALTAPDGRQYPVVPKQPEQIAALLTAIETAQRNPSTPEAQLPGLGHHQQVIYRQLAASPGLAATVRQQLPLRWHRVLDHHLAARRAFLTMARGSQPRTTVPAWRIVPPEPAESLLRYYRKAAAATGIRWEVLAAVNLVETGMGRIDGVSVANAQGPMQFLPSTWAERGIGQGNIRDPHDAIQAAARYLVRRGGLRDIRRGLWGYNNSTEYGNAVLHYADLLSEDPLAYRGLYHWEIHVLTSRGDLWLPVGYSQQQRVSVAHHLRQMPWSAPAVAPGPSIRQDQSSLP